MSFSFYPRTVFKTKSKFNSLIVVKEQFGKYTLDVNGIIQSGGLVEILWKKALRKLIVRHPEKSATKDLLHFQNKGGILRSAQNDNISQILILGLGGGTLVNLLKIKYPNCEITGVEIDEGIINIGKKYLGFDKVSGLKIAHADAIEFARKYCSDDPDHQSSYNMVFVDLYCGKEVCSGLLKEEFIKNIKKILAPDGAVIINWLKVKDSARFEKLLKGIFDNVYSKEVFSNKFYYCC